jgi:DNA primase
LFNLRDHSLVATGGEGQLRNLELPPEVQNVIIASDGDDVGLNASKALAVRLKAGGFNVRIKAPTGYKDWNEVLLSQCG